MVNISRRMRSLKALLAIRLGPGAAVLPKDVKRIHLDFAYKINDGHFGARKFWRLYLPRLKYHNPAVSMTVNRTTSQTGPATLTVFFAPPADSASPTASPAPATSTSGNLPTDNKDPWTRTESVEMKHKREEDILDKFIVITKATPVEATPEEQAELLELEEMDTKSKADKARNDAYVAVKKAEQALKDQAMGKITDAQVVSK